MKTRLINLVLLTLLWVMLEACTGAAIAVGPPPPPNEVVVVAPSARHVWTPGYYVYRRNNYVWQNGRYTVAPRNRTAWVPGQWVQTPRGYVWVRGHWR